MSSIDKGAYKKWLNQLNGQPMSLTIPELARLMCGLPYNSPLPDQSVMTVAQKMLLHALYHPPVGFSTQELRGGKFKIEFRRLEHDKH
jgi:hypothetical protein